MRRSAEKDEAVSGYSNACNFGLLFRIMGVEVFVPLLQVITSWASPVSRLYAQLMMDELIIHR